VGRFAKAAESRSIYGVVYKDIGTALSDGKNPKYLEFPPFGGG
jgi:hypothetical protein